jgi:ferritin-like protein
MTHGDDLRIGDLDLATLDRDGAVREAAAALPTRGQVLGGARAAAGALAACLVLPSGAFAARVSRHDRSILNYALSLEYLQDAFYTEADRVGALTGARRTAAGVLGGVERAHVRAFRSLLGSSAAPRPRFDFRGTTEEDDAFLRTAVAFEDLSVAAYKAQAPRIASRAVLQAAVGIHSVEARHAAWMRHLVGVQPAASAFDEPKGRRQVVATVASTRFIVDRAPRTESRRRAPSFTG